MSNTPATETGNAKAAQTETCEVINAYNGKNVAYSESEFSGTREECEEFIEAALAAQREQAGMANTGTFLAVRNAETFEWV